MSKTELLQKDLPEEVILQKLKTYIAIGDDFAKNKETGRYSTFQLCDDVQSLFMHAIETYNYADIDKIFEMLMSVYQKKIETIRNYGCHNDRCEAMSMEDFVMQGCETLLQKVIARRLQNSSYISDPAFKQKTKPTISQ